MQLRVATLHYALFRLAFAPAPALNLNLAAYLNSPVRSTKSTPSGLNALRLFVGITVSGSISLPSRGAFHLSLTVLLHYRSQVVFSLGRWSSRFPTGFPVPRGTQVAHSPIHTFRLQDSHLLRCGFPSASTR